MIYLPDEHFQLNLTVKFDKNQSIFIPFYCCFHAILFSKNDKQAEKELSKSSEFSVDFDKIKNDNHLKKLILSN